MSMAFIDYGPIDPLRGEFVGDGVARTAGGLPYDPVSGELLPEDVSLKDGTYRQLTPIGEFVSHRLKMVDYLPLGIGNILFSGEGALGKSSVAQRLAARVTLGTTEGEWNGRPHGVLFILSEDGGGDIKNAMKAYGADTSRVYAYAEATNPSMSDREASTVTLPDDIPYLREMCKEKDIRLIVLDALSDSMTGMNLNRHADVGAVVTALGHWSQNDDVLVIGIHHNGKSLTHAKLSPVGSEAFVNKSRCLVSFEQADEDRYVMQLTKVNRLKGNPSYEYTFKEVQVDSDEGHTKVGMIASITSSDLRVDAIRAEKSEFAQDVDAEDRNAAQSFILDYLTEQGGEAPAREILKAGHMAGFGENELKNARKRSQNPHFVTRKSGGSGKGWVWAIEDESKGVTTSQNSHTSKNMTPLTPLSNTNDSHVTPLPKNTKGVTSKNTTPLPENSLVQASIDDLAEVEYPSDIDFTALDPAQLEAALKRPGLWHAKATEEQTRRLKGAA